MLFLLFVLSYWRNNTLTPAHTGPNTQQIPILHSKINPRGIHSYLDSSQLLTTLGPEGKVLKNGVTRWPENAILAVNFVRIEKEKQRQILILMGDV